MAVGALLVCFVPLAGNDDEVAGTRKTKGFADGGGTVGDDRGGGTGIHAGADFAEDGVGGLVAGVVAGQDGGVG